MDFKHKVGWKEGSSEKCNRPCPSAAVPEMSNPVLLDKEPLACLVKQAEQVQAELLLVEQLLHLELGDLLAVGHHVEAGPHVHQAPAQDKRSGCETIC